jgi:hypothetical protein
MAKKTKVPARLLSAEELESLVYSTIQRASGLKGSEFKKELDSDCKAYEKQAVTIATALASQGKAYRFSSKTTVRFFREDPFDVLSVAARNLLSSAPRTATELKQGLEKTKRGFGDLAVEWLKGAVQRGEIYELAPAKGGRSKRYGLEPDWALVLKKTSLELRKVLDSSVGRRWSAENIITHLAQLMGVKTPEVSHRDRVLQELKRLGAEKPNEALLMIRELRSRVGLEKKAFDESILELSRSGDVVLHHHDFPTSLSESERSMLVEDERGTHYVGIALRRKP